MIRSPKHIDEFRKWGCNYWDAWAQPDGSINIDYGNEWFANGQIAHLKNCLANDQSNRRMIISGWNPSNLNDLDLPCCHYSYQFYVSEGRLSMLWTQRSVDLMVGLPSDIVFAALWIITLANEFGLIPGEIKMSLGDCHIYEEHLDNTEEYLDRVDANYQHRLTPPAYRLNMEKGAAFETFEPDHLVLSIYQKLAKLNFKLKV